MSTFYCFLICVIDLGLIFMILHPPPQKKENCLFRPINQKVFYENLIKCKGVITNAGFQTTSESVGQMMF